MIVEMRDTPKFKSLRHVGEEVRIVYDLMSCSMETHVLQSPTKHQVISMLQSCQIAHFACHGASDDTDPSKSVLYLKDWEADRLTVTDITNLKLQDAQLAFLSACKTSICPLEEVQDEGIHLSGACQLAGFSHVIGTLWTVDDESSAIVAKSVYNFMKEEGGNIDIQRSAISLHKAVRKLQNEIIYPGKAVSNDPLIWAPYIHWGA